MNAAQIDVFSVQKSCTSCPNLGGGGHHIQKNSSIFSGFLPLEVRGYFINGKIRSFWRVLLGGV